MDVEKSGNRVNRRRESKFVVPRLRVGATQGEQKWGIISLKNAVVVFFE